jgi:mannose-6-phosphate isomerase-like protein (cupin superfamily)
MPRRTKKLQTETAVGQGGRMAGFNTKVIGLQPDATAPDGSQVRLLLEVTRGGMAHFALAPQQVSVGYRTIEEIWYFVRGRVAWPLGDCEEVVEVYPGVSITIPTGTWFQFRSDTDAPLEAIGVTMPPWPGAEEAFLVEGIWMPTV